MSDGEYPSYCFVWFPKLKKQMHRPGEVKMPPIILVGRWVVTLLSWRYTMFVLVSKTHPHGDQRFVKQVDWIWFMRPKYWRWAKA